VYCWGKAPASGTEVKIQVILEKVPLPLLEISFRVPYPSDEVMAILEPPEEYEMTFLHVPKFPTGFLRLVQE
ncbi:MAG: hypothetical protein P8Y68_07700, partial [Anaerolineales bacterium]